LRLRIATLCTSVGEWGWGLTVQQLSRSAPRRNGTHRSKANSGLTIAVVGCGYWGAKHIRVVGALPEVSEVVVVDPDPRARSVIASTFPNAVLAAELEPILGRVDGVIVATPPLSHAKIGLSVLRAGKPVMIEKPLAASLAESRSLVAEAARQGAILMVGHTFEFNPVVRELRHRMDNGDLGEVHYIHSARLNLGLYRSDVNVVWDLAPHDISIMSYLLRSSPNAVSAWGSSHVSSDVSDLAYFQLEFRDRGVMGYGHVSWLDPRKVRQITVVGSRKMAVYDDLAEEKLRIFDRGVDQDRLGTERKMPLHAMPISYRYGDIVSPHINFQEPLLLEDRHFIDCIRNKTTPLTDGASGLAVVSVLEAMDKAIASRSIVEIEPGPQQPAPVPIRLTG
jgi:predicted dehydrogenase